MKSWIWGSALLFLAACGSAEQKSNTQKALEAAPQNADAEYIMQGNAIADAAQQQLLKTLSKALADKGAAEAVGFCSLQALPLLDSLSKSKNVQIGRISDRYRNPADAPKGIDNEVLNAYKAAAAARQPLEATVRHSGQEVYFYRPIMIAMPGCLQCHGNADKDISPEVAAALKSRYPDDLATGYALGELRGAWKLRLK